ncbi:MAG: hypothetical protein GKR94_27265 [Gammaproteobacteria bacterium]|nr:hypothetical protein [Gammaproteobacteria bacterium]
MSDAKRRRPKFITLLDSANTKPSALKKYPPPHTRVIVPIETGKILDRPVELPAAAAENLRQVLYLQMEKVTPFGADDIVFSSTVQRRGKGEQPMLVDLQVAPRRLAQAERDALARAGFALPWEWARVEPYQDGMAIAFTPPRLRQGLSSFNLFIWALNLILLAALVAWPFWEQHQMLERLDAQITAVRGEAKKVSALRDELDALAAEREVLSRLRYRPPSAAQLLEDVASHLPDDTWLRQFTIKSDTLILTGLSPRAPQLLQRLEASKWLENVQLAAALRAVQGQSGGEQFVIEAAILRSGAQ